MGEGTWGGCPCTHEQGVPPCGWFSCGCGLDGATGYTPGLPWDALPAILSPSLLPGNVDSILPHCGVQKQPLLL